MTRDALREAARVATRAANRRLARTGRLDMYFVYIPPAGDPIKDVPDQAILNSPDAKAIQFKHVAERARELHAEAVMFVSDAWLLDSREPPYRDLMQAVEPDEWISLQNRPGVLAAAKMGMGVAREVIQVLAQTPDWAYSLIQIYERLGAERRHIRFTGDPLVGDEDIPGCKAIGRARDIFGERHL